ncbi:MAG: hypothetical protein ABFD46_12120 [Armatimonadota bacterium]
MEKHFRLLGYLFIIYGVWVLVNIVLAVLFFVSGGKRAAVPPGQETVSIILAVIFAILFSITGWALLARRYWARSVSIAASIIALLSIPIGTALGIYGLWVMFSENGRREYPLYAGSPPPEHPVPGQ